MDVPPLASTANKPPRRWWERRLVFWPVALVMLGTFVWQCENYRGLRIMVLQMEALEAQGASLQWKPGYLPGPVPDADNFGAAACLEGIVDGDRDYGEGGEETVRKEIRGLGGLSFEEARRPSEEFAPTPRRMRKWVLALPSRHNEEAWDWAMWRCALLYSDYFPMIHDDVPDAWAVLRGLDKLEPLFSQLAEAARRPHAVFLPSPRERWKGGPPILDDADRSGSLVQRLYELLSLRARAAIACEDHNEAARMLRILFKLDDAINNEEGFACTRFRGSMIFLEGLQHHVWTIAELDEFSAALTMDAEALILHDLQLLILYDCTDRTVVGRNWFSRFDSNEFPWFLPAGWWDLGRARNMRIYRREMLEPLQKAGLAGLARQSKYYRYAINENHLFAWPVGFLARRDTPVTNLDLWGEMRRRLLLAGVAAEKRLMNDGRYPVKLELPGKEKDWMDLDAKLLRYVVSDDGKKAVLYSLGMDMENDWSGMPPPVAPRVRSQLSPPRKPAARKENASETSGETAPAPTVALKSPAGPLPPRDLAWDYRDEDWVIVLRAPGP